MLRAFAWPLLGYHAMCIVGFDDAKDGGAGAFKVRNSWGDWWGEQGYLWIGYQTFIDSACPYIECEYLYDEYDAAVAERFLSVEAELAPPTHVQASDGEYGDKIVVTWTKSSGATSYKLYRDAESNLVGVVGDVDNWSDTAVEDYLGHIYWVRAATADQESGLSAPDVGYLGQAPVINDVAPTSGSSGAVVTFSANVSGQTPLTYLWNFGGGATPNTSGNAAPQVTLGAAGFCGASLTVSNAFGEDTLHFTLTVVAGPTYTASGYVRTGGGMGIADVTMSFSGDVTSVQTDAGGYWHQSGITPGSYTVTPQKTGLSFAPVSRSFQIVDRDVSVGDFTGSMTEGINITSLTTDKTTHFSGGGEPASNITATTDVPANSYEWTASLGSVTGSGATVTWSPPVGASAQVVLITCTVYEGLDSDNAVLKLYVTDETIKTTYGNNGHYLDFSNLPSNEVSNPPYRAFSYYATQDHVILLNIWGVW